MLYWKKYGIFYLNRKKRKDDMSVQWKSQN